MNDLKNKPSINFGNAAGKSMHPLTSLCYIPSQSVRSVSETKLRRAAFDMQNKHDEVPLCISQTDDKHIQAATEQRRPCVFVRP